MAVVLFTLPLLGDITLGTAIGVVAGVAEFLLARGPKNPAPKAMTSAWGETWPIVYNTFRVPGKVIQAGELNQVDVKLGPGKKTTDFSLTFAVGICEGVVSLGRIWADNQVIYDPRPNANPPNWQANHLYGTGDQIFAPGVTDWIFTATVNGQSGATQPAWNFLSDGATRDNEEVWLATKYRPRNKIGKQYNFYFGFYPGTEDQLPDSSLEELVGAGSQPAYRGVAYVVFYSFDLSRYGNRIPNFEFEVTAAGPNPNRFISGAEYYGDFTGGSGVISLPPFATDDGGNIYAIGDVLTAHTRAILNIKTGTYTNITDSQINTDSASFGGPSAGGAGSWGLQFIAGKYVLAFTVHDQGPWLGWTAVIYEINDDGTMTALGVKGYQSSLAGNVYVGTIEAVTVRPDTQEIMIAYADFGTEGVNVMVLDSVANLQGNFALRAGSRIQHIAEIGSQGGAPAPFLGYIMGFVGSVLYIALNKAHMDWLAGHSSGSGFCAYYKTLQPGNPNGCLVKIETFSDDAGTLTYVFDGVSTDFGWPFADEGLNKAGNPGQTNAAPYDDYSPPVQQQEVNGTVDGVFFTRAYSDVGANNQLGVKQFTGTGAFFAEVDGAPYAVSTIREPAEPLAVFINDGIYGAFFSSGTNYVKLGAFEPALLTLADITADVSKRVGLVDAQLDLSSLASVVPLGVALMQRDTARSFIESMQPAFFFDLTDIGAKVVGSLRSQDAILQVIPEADLSATPAQATTQQNTVVDKISSVRNDDLEIPEDLSITYYDSQHDYQQGSQQARRSKVTTYSSGKNTVSVPVVMTPWDANNAAQRGLFLLWVERVQRKFILPPEYLARTAVDVVQLSRDGRNYVVRITRATIKANWTIEIDSVSEDLGTYSVEGTTPLTSLASGSFTDGRINPPTTPVLAVVDTATLRPDDLTLPGVYLAAANSDGGTYDTVTVQESVDDSVFTDQASLPHEAAIGTVAVALGAPTHYKVWDSVNTLTVKLLFGTLASADKWALTSDITTNLAWLSNGEIIQFATATLNSDGTYTLSGLRRGRLGTEQFCSTHGANETLVILNEAVMGNATYSAADIGATRYWQALNDAPNNPASAVQTLVMATRRLLPYAPTFIRGSRDLSKNLTITGLRRTRWHGQPLWSPAETDTPIAVEIDVLNGASVVRTLTSTLSANGSGITAVPSPGPFTAYYAEADQVIDFGSAQASVSLKAYSRNATIGRGYAGARAV